MKAEASAHQRRSMRLPEYDYATPGAYFVTIVAEQRSRLFGEVRDGDLRLNDAGRMIESWWHEIEHKFPDVRTDEFIVMPNHFHGIIMIDPDGVGAALRGRPSSSQHRNNLADPTPDEGGHIGPPLHRIVGWFKTMTTNAYVRGVRDDGWARFDGQLWQRNYYEHVVRNDSDLSVVRQYIIDNPAKWADDPENEARARLQPAAGSHAQ